MTNVWEFACEKGDHFKTLNLWVIDFCFVSTVNKDYIQKNVVYTKNAGHPVNMSLHKNPTEFFVRFFS